MEAAALRHQSWPPHLNAPGGGAANASPVSARSFDLAPLGCLYTPPPAATFRRCSWSARGALAVGGRELWNKIRQPTSWPGPKGKVRSSSMTRPASIVLGPTDKAAAVMQVFAIFNVHDPALVRSALERNYGKNFFAARTGVFLVASEGETTRDVANKASIGEDDGHGVTSGIIVSVTNYWGRASSDLWEWIHVKRRANG